jgi:ferritin-like metal-binding protein YciE
MAIKTTQEKFMHELGDILDAENQFLKAQQDMLEQATDSTLKDGIEQHIQETEQQIKNLEQVFSEMGEEPERVKCSGAQGIVAEAKHGVKEAGTPEIRDLFIGASLLKVEHYEITSYQGLHLAAKQMGQDKAAKLFAENLKQEEKTAEKLQGSAPKLLETAMEAEGATAS